jgi:hypothetical protein
MIDYEKTKAWRSDPVRHTYTERDTILYALGVGFAADPLVLEELRFVYEKELQAVPTMAAVLASPGFWMRDRKELGIDYLKLVHGEQGVTIHSPLPAAGTLIGQSRVTRIVDKGEGKGATMHVEKTLTDEASGRPVATAEMVALLARRWWVLEERRWGRACACCACDTRCGAGGDDRNADPRGCRRAVPSLGRHQSAAHRSCSCCQGRISPTDPAWPRNLWQRMPRHPGEVLRARCVAHEVDPRAVDFAGLSRRNAGA